MLNKKVLIVSNECLSKTTSNGRTMLNLFLGYPPSLLAQFYIHGTPDESVCNNYFRVSDKDALNAFLIRRTKNTQPYKTSSGPSHDKKIARNFKNMVLRDMVWMSFKWWNKDFELFISNFSPDIVLLQAGDCPFMFAIARRISQKYSIPLIMYNSESYVLKKKLYYSARPYSPWHCILLSRLKYEYKRFMNSCSFCIYSMEQLEDAYQKAYPHSGKSRTIYVSTDISARTDYTHHNIEKPFTIAYCGNMGVGRLEYLLDLADVLQKLDPSAKLILCGNLQSSEDLELVRRHPSIDYRGFLNYNEVIKIIKDSSMVVHCENSDRLQNLKYAFSTKIADSLACGTPFLVYATRDYPFVQYLEKHSAAHIAGDKEELERILKKCLTDTDYLLKPVSNALSLVEKNHSIENNALIFQNIINSVCSGNMNI